MPITRAFAVTTAAILLTVGSARLTLLPGATPAPARAATATPDLSVGPQYDSTHVYVAPEDFDRFVASVLATFGGTASKTIAVEARIELNACTFRPATVS